MPKFSDKAKRKPRKVPALRRPAPRPRPGFLERIVVVGSTPGVDSMGDRVFPERDT
jgi:hypothetical protein